MFSYTVASGENTADLEVIGFNTGGATLEDAEGNALVTSGSIADPTGDLLIDTTAPTVTSVVASGSGISNGSGDQKQSEAITLTVNTSEAITVDTTGGTPALTLNTGDTVNYASGSGSSALVFTYTIGAGDNVDDLQIVGFALNGGTFRDSAGNDLSTGPIVTNPVGILVVDTTAPSAPVITAISDDTGTEGDKITSDTSLTISGTGEVGASVQVSLGGSEVGSAVTVDSDGNWSYTHGSTLSAGDHSFTDHD